MVKLIANERIHKTEVGGELEVADNVAKVLVLLGKAKYAEESVAPAPVAPTPRPRGRPRRVQPTGTAIGALTTTNVKANQ